MDPVSPQFFSTPERKGGPTAVIYGFEDAYNILYHDIKKYGGYNIHPLYIALYKLHSVNANTIGYEIEHPGCQEFGIPPPNVAPAIMKKQELKPAEVTPAQNPVQSQEPQAVSLPQIDGMPLQASSPQPSAIPPANQPLTPVVPSIVPPQPTTSDAPQIPRCRLR